MPKQQSVENISKQNSYIAEIKQILASARQKAYSAINSAMVEAYWFIGRRIVIEEQQGKERAEYGAYVIKTLSEELTAEFGKGFSERSIRQFRQFYQMFSETTIARNPLAQLQNTENKQIEIRRDPLAEFKNTELSPYLSRLNWTQIQRIMRVSNPDARAYYIKETDKTIAQYSVLNENKQLFATKYMEYLPTEEELRREIERQKEIFMLQQTSKRVNSE